MSHSFYDLLAEFPEFNRPWPPANVPADEWLATEDAVLARRTSPDPNAPNFALLPDHCKHQGGITVVGQCILCGSFPKGNEFRKNLKP